MLSIEHVTKLLDDTTISAEEAGRIRDACCAMVEIIYQKWSEEIKANILTCNHTNDAKR